MKRASGFSLIELMIAMAIGLVLMTGVLQVFLSSRQVYTTQDAVARIQETGRLAVEFLSNDIRMAGYTGCVSGDIGKITNTLNNATDFLWRFDVGIEGYDVNNDSGGALPAGVVLAPAPASGTDVIVMRGALGNGISIVANNNGGQLFAEHLGTEAGACADGDDRVSGLCGKDILVVSDCAKARVFQASAVDVSSSEVNVRHSNATMNPGNAISSWGGSSAPEEERFGEDSEIIKLNTVIYYIATSATTGRRGLWQKVGDSPAYEMLEGIENMHVVYGLDTDSDSIPNSYRTATQVTAANAWKDVQSARIELLAQSTEDNVLGDPQPYTFKNAAVTPTDRRLRQVFVASVGIRSRLK